MTFTSTLASEFCTLEVVRVQDQRNKDRKTGHIIAETETQTTFIFNQYTAMKIPREVAEALTLPTNASLVVSLDSTKK
jgi:hypothetical protein